MRLDILIVEVCALSAKIWRNIYFSLMASLICIKKVWGTFCQLFNIASRFLWYFPNLETSSSNRFQRGARYPLPPAQLLSLHTGRAVSGGVFSGGWPCLVVKRCRLSRRSSRDQFSRTPKVSSSPMHSNIQYCECGESSAPDLGVWGHFRPKALVGPSLVVQKTFCVRIAGVVR